MGGTISNTSSEWFLSYSDPDLENSERGGRDSRHPSRRRQRHAFCGRNKSSRDGSVVNEQGCRVTFKTVELEVLPCILR